MDKVLISRTAAKSPQVGFNIGMAVGSDTQGRGRVLVSVNLSDDDYKIRVTQGTERHDSNVVHRLESARQKVSRLSRRCQSLSLVFAFDLAQQG